MKYVFATALALVFLLTSSPATRAEPPLGTWVSDHPGMMAFTLSPDGTYTMPPSTAGTWSWNQTSPSGGILTLNYDTVTVTQTFHNSMYFSIEFTDANTATFTDPASQLSDTIRKQ